MDATAAIDNRYRLIRELGSGGMACVWLAERIDGLIDRPVALKFPHITRRQAGLDARIARERDILASLNHPNIARLYDAGLTADARPYLALEYIEGEPIDHYCETHRLGVRERLRLFKQVAGAVAYAHAQLIVHRDLKPSNVLVTGQGEVRLLDFGIARLLAESTRRPSDLTEECTAALTFAYASPEQIQDLPITVAADVYSLGVLLYELLTGTHPYGADCSSRGAFEEAILQKQPPRPSEVAPKLYRQSLRGDIDTIVLKALKKQPEERYATVNALSEDIDRHLASLPVRARPDGAWYRLNRLLLRNRVVIVAVSVALAAIIAAAVISLRQAHLANAARLRTEQINAFIGSIFEQANPYYGTGKEIGAAQLLTSAREDLTTRFSDQPELKAELLNIIAASLISLGAADAAEEALRQALATAGDSPGAAAQLLQSQVLLLEVQNIRRNFDELAKGLKHLLPAAQGWRDTHPEILLRALTLATDLAIEQGRYDEMLAPISEAVQLARRQLGSSHPLTDRVMVLLAETQVMRIGTLNNGAVRQQMLQQTALLLDQLVAAHPGQPDHPHILRVREVRGRALAVAGLFRESVEESRRALKSMESIFGPGPQTAAFMATLAPYERRLGELDVALRHVDEAQALFDLHMDGGTRHTQESADDAYMQTTRGTILLFARKPSSALPDLQAARTIYQGLFGAKHWDTLTARLNGAVASAYLGHFEQAHAALSAVHDKSTEIAVPWWTLHTEGIVARLRGDYGAAISLQHQAQRLIPEGPRADWELVRVLGERGQAELAIGQYKQAGATLTQARDLFVRLAIAMHPPYAETLTGLGATMLQSDPVAALALLERGNAFWLEHDANNTAGGEAAWWLARCYGALDRRNDAATLAARARQLLSASPLPRDKELLQRM